MKGAAPIGPLDKAQARALRERLRGLTPAQAEMLREAMRLHAAGDRMMSAQWLLQVAREAPDHPEVQLWQGLRHFEATQWVEAAAQLQRAATQRSDDFSLWCMLGVAQGRAHQGEAARASLLQALRCASTPAQALKLALECDGLGFFDEALRACDALLALDPRSAPGLLERIRCHKALGHSAAAAADCRTLIAQGREVAKAWFSLVDLKTVALDEAERAALDSAARQPGRPAEEQLLLQFALGKVLEDAGEHAAALAALQRANDAAGRRSPWDAASFARYVHDLEAAFATEVPQAPAAQGEEVIFLVGLPRSGSTLVEQVLAAHPAVEGASELPYLNQVLQAESTRRGQAYPAWVGAATAADWQRLGQDYLRLSASWRSRRPRATDKLPDNWQFAGAIRAMLPGARIVDCRRDALETCWSCYKQLFGPGLAVFSYGFESLAQYWAACEAEGDRWAARAPERFRIQRYEALVAEPEAQIRELLAFCGLPFDAACLSFQHAERAIRTPSALQVRLPMKQTSTPAAGYGALLQPLRAALAAAAAAKQTA